MEGSGAGEVLVGVSAPFPPLKDRPRLVYSPGARDRGLYEIRLLAARCRRYLSNQVQNEDSTRYFGITRTNSQNW